MQNKCSIRFHLRYLSVQAAFRIVPVPLTLKPDLTEVHRRFQKIQQKEFSDANVKYAHFEFERVQNDRIIL